MDVYDILHANASRPAYKIHSEKGALIDLGIHFVYNCDFLLQCIIVDSVEMCIHLYNILTGTVCKL